MRHYHLAVTIPGQLTRYCTQLFWNETAYVLDSAGNNTSTVGGTQNANDMVYACPTNGTLDLYVKEKATNGFYYISFRVPGANTGIA